MLNTTTGQKLALCLTASALTSLSASAAVIYDNATDGFTGTRSDLTVEHGDIIGFAGTERILTDVSFEYFLTPGGAATATLNIYSLDGGSVGSGVNLPGTLLYTSGAFNIGTGTSAEGYGTASISDLAVTLPDNIAWTVTFGGLDGAEAAGLLFYDATGGIGTNPTFLDPGLGNTAQHFTIQQGTSGWELLNHDGVVDNFGVQFTAVPEPTTWALMLGGLAVVGLARRRK